MHGPEDVHCVGNIRGNHCSRVCIRPHLRTAGANAPIGLKYDFSGIGAQEYLSNYAMLPIVVNRIIWSLTTLLHKKTTKSLDLERQGFCHMTWMYSPYMRSVSQMAAMLIGDPPTWACLQDVRRDRNGLLSETSYKL